jgi:hypothetical protein
MNYLQWNKAIWDFYFMNNCPDKKIILSVTRKTITNLGEKNQVIKPIEDFINAINSGPVDKDGNGIDPFYFSDKDSHKYDILTKAYLLIKEKNYYTSNRTLGISPKSIPRWKKEECLITAYIAFLVLMINDRSEENNRYWENLNNNLICKTTSNSQKLTENLFDHLLLWAKNKNQNFYFENIYTVKKNTGIIYSQLPFTEDEEKEFIASLYAMKSEDPNNFDLIISEGINHDFYEEFILQQKQYLNSATKKELNNPAGNLYEILINYLSQNLLSYAKEAQNTSGKFKEEIDTILVNRTNRNSNYIPKYYLSFRDGKIIGVLVLNLRITGAVQNLILKNKKNEFTANLKFDVHDDESEFYRAYCFFEPLNNGKYEIFNNEEDTGYEFEISLAEKISNINFPIWYRNFSVSSGQKLRIIETKKDIEFDINNPHRILIDNAINSLSEENNNYKIVSNTKKYILYISEKTYNLEDISIIFKGEIDKINLLGKSIRIVNTKVNINIEGAPDGVPGTTSFLSDIPITISFDRTNIKKVEIHEIKTDCQIVKFTIILEDNDQPDDTNFIKKDYYEVSNYVVKIFDQEDNLVRERNFATKNGDNRDNRSPIVNLIGICNYVPISIRENELSKNENSAFTFSYLFIEKLINILIKGKLINTIYSSDFKLIFTSIIEEFHPEILESQQWSELELSKLVLYLLDSLNIIEREVHSIKNIIKPFWVESTIIDGNNKYYNLTGALSHSDITWLENNPNDLNIIWEIKKVSRFVYWNNKNLEVTFELPRQFAVKSDDSTFKEQTPFVVLYKADQKFDFDLKEPDNRLYDIEKQHLMVEMTSKYFIPLQNIFVLNFFTLKYNLISKEQFKEILTYSGYKLIKVKSELHSKKQIMEHYFLFHIDNNVITYKYFPYAERQAASRLYFKKLQYFDLTSIMLKADDSDWKKICNYLVRNPINATSQIAILSDLENKNEIKKMINNQLAFKLDTNNSNKHLTELLKYDSTKFIFAMHNSIKLPKKIEKYLIAVSGYLPYLEELEFEAPNSELTELATGKKFIEKRSWFHVYSNIPEEFAFKISNSIFKQIAVKTPGATKKPYSNFYKY